MVEVAQQEGGNLCPACGGSNNVSLGISYEATAIFRKRRCKECGVLFKEWLRDYRTKENGNG